jgi:hypothetical protein
MMGGDTKLLLHTILVSIKNKALHFVRDIRFEVAIIATVL